MKKNRRKKKAIVESLALSPEAMRPEEFARHLASLGHDGGLTYVQHLRDTNGSAEPHEDGPDVVWALRTESTGRWATVPDKYGVKSLAVFRLRSYVRDLIAVGLGLEDATDERKENAVVGAGFRIVWMQFPTFLHKVRAAAQTGHPEQVILLCGIETGRTEECVWSCKDLAGEGGFFTLARELALRWREPGGDKETEM